MKLLILVLLTLILNNHLAFSQVPPSLPKNDDNSLILNQKQTLQTDVFILNTCNPNQLSIVRMYDDYRQVKIIPVRRLSAPTNRFSTFKIININPNRYTYNINNTLVTQFVDNNPFSPDNNQFTNGSSLPVDDIEIIELFKPDNNFEPKRRKIEAIKSDLKGFSKEIFKTSDEIDVLLVKIGSAEKKDKLGIQKEIDELKNKHTEAIIKYGETLDTYISLVGKLTVNENLQTVLSNFILLKTDTSIHSSELENLVDNVGSLASDLKKDISSLDNIKDKIRKLSNDYDYKYRKLGTRESDTLNRNIGSDPVSELQSKGYTINIYDLQSLNKSDRTLEIAKMEEFISDKKISEWEFFVLNTSKEIAKLLQNKIIEYSEQKNRISQQSCIDQSWIKESAEACDDIRKYFKIIRNMCADLNVLIKYLELNDAVFGSIVNGVNNNYNKLKNFLAFFTHINSNHTAEFTLPSHTNLKNVDLIRYKIDRHDNITQANQTYVYDVWLKGGLKVDFSAGILATNLVDREYEKLAAYSASNPTILLTDSVIINRKDIGKLDFAFGGMVNILYRTGASWITPGISFGVAYSKNQKLQFLGSVSLQLGKTERIILHGGFAAGLTKTLNLANLNYNKMIDTEDGRHYLVKGKYEEFNFQTIDKFRIKPFFGISYNLSKKNALQAASTSNNFAPVGNGGGSKPEDTPK